MKYYVIKIETSTDGTETRDLRAFDTLDEAVVRYHSDLAKYVGNTNHILEMVIDENGRVIKRETYTKTEEVAETESAE